MSSGISESQRGKVIQEVFHCFQKGLEIIVASRQSCQPSADSSNRPSGHIENSKYIGVVSRVAECDPYVPLCLEILYEKGPSGMDTSSSLTLLEKWVFQYDFKSSGQVSSKHMQLRTNPAYNAKRIGLFLRTLYCFARLLPSFYVATSSNSRLLYRISTLKAAGGGASGPSSDEHPMLQYQFPAVPMLSGSMLLSVSYIDPNALQVVAATTLVAPAKSGGSYGTAQQHGHGQSSNTNFQQHSQSNRLPQRGGGGGPGDNRRYSTSGVTPALQAALQAELPDPGFHRHSAGSHAGGGGGGGVTMPIPPPRHPGGGGGGSGGGNGEDSQSGSSGSRGQSHSQGSPSMPIPIHMNRSSDGQLQRNASPYQVQQQQQLQAQTYGGGGGRSGSTGASPPGANRYQHQSHEQHQHQHQHQQRLQEGYEDLQSSANTFQQTHPPRNARASPQYEQQGGYQQHALGGDEDTGYYNLHRESSNSLPTNTYFHPFQTGPGGAQQQRPPVVPSQTPPGGGFVTGGGALSRKNSGGGDNSEPNYVSVNTNNSNNNSNYYGVGSSQVAAGGYYSGLSPQGELAPLSNYWSTSSVAALQRQQHLLNAGPGPAAMGSYFNSGQQQVNNGPGNVGNFTSMPNAQSLPQQSPPFMQVSPTLHAGGVGTLGGGMMSGSPGTFSNPGAMGTAAATAAAMLWRQQPNAGGTAVGGLNYPNYWQAGQGGGGVGSGAGAGASAAAGSGVAEGPGFFSSASAGAGAAGAGGVSRNVSGKASDASSNSSAKDNTLFARLIKRKEAILVQSSGRGSGSAEGDAAGAGAGAGTGDDHQSSEGSTTSSASLLQELSKLPAFPSTPFEASFGFGASSGELGGGAGAGAGAGNTPGSAANTSNGTPQQAGSVGNNVPASSGARHSRRRGSGNNSLFDRGSSYGYGGYGGSILLEGNEEDEDGMSDSDCRGSEMLSSDDDDDDDDDEDMPFAWVPDSTTTVAVQRSPSRDVVSSKHHTHTTGMTRTDSNGSNSVTGGVTAKGTGLAQKCANAPPLSHFIEIQQAQYQLHQASLSIFQQQQQGQGPQTAAATAATTAAANSAMDPRRSVLCSINSSYETLLQRLQQQQQQQQQSTEGSGENDLDRSRGESVDVPPQPQQQAQAQNDGMAIPSSN